jgi:Rrf2 family transcriptional regulator, cysteine metabolism repressor
MLVAQKSRYSLRALFELARRGHDRPVTIGEIAHAQQIPARFLESILVALKRGGFVESRRGAEGGYILARPAARISVGEILRFMQGPLEPVECLSDPPREACPLRPDCVFVPMWQEAARAVSSVYDATSLQSLVDRDAEQRRSRPLDYSI